MKYCVYCGSEIPCEEAVICVKCGRSIGQSQTNTASTSKDDSMQTVVKVFLIISCIAQGWLLIPLAWCLPITISIFNAFRDRKPIGTGLKVCTLLFVNMIAGICLLCMNDNT